MNEPKENPWFAMAKEVLNAVAQQRLPEGFAGGDSVPVTVPGLIQQLQDALREDRDPDEPVRLALSLASLLAIQRGWSRGKAVQEAGLIWLQFEPLRRK